MNIKLANLIMFLVTIQYSLIATAANGGKIYEQPFDFSNAPKPQPAMTVEKYNEELKASQARAKRTIAKADSLNEMEILSDDFKNLRNELIGGPRYLNGAIVPEQDFPGIPLPGDPNDKAYVAEKAGVAQLDRYLTKLNDPVFYDKLAPDAQWAALQLAPLKVYRGVINRAIKLMGKTAIAKMAVVTSIRMLATAVVTYLPTDQWKTGIAYINRPIDNMGFDIKTEADIQRFVSEEVIKSALEVEKRIVKLIEDSGEKAFYFDNKILYGTADFSKVDQNRFVMITKTERLALLAAVQFGLSSTFSLCSYSMNGAFRAMQEAAEKYGFHSLFFDVEGASAKGRFDIMSSFNQDGLFKANKGYENGMANAYHYLVQSAKNAKLSWDGLQKGAVAPPVVNWNLMNPTAFTPFSRGINSGFEMLNDLLDLDGKSAGEATIQSAVDSKDVLKVTLKKFFVGPDVPKDLGVFMPVKGGFDTSDYKQWLKIKLNGKTVDRAWHNFLSGRPTKWNYSEYSKYMTPVTDADQVRSAARIFSQAWGGWMLGVPFSLMVL